MGKTPERKLEIPASAFNLGHSVVSVMSSPSRPDVENKSVFSGGESAAAPHRWPFSVDNPSKSLSIMAASVAPFTKPPTLWWVRRDKILQCLMSVFPFLWRRQIHRHSQALWPRSSNPVLNPKYAPWKELIVYIYRVTGCFGGFFVKGMEKKKTCLHFMHFCKNLCYSSGSKHDLMSI